MKINVSHVDSLETQAKIKQLLVDPEFAQQPDDDKLNPWVDHQEALKGNISRFDAVGLQLSSLVYEGVFSKENPPSKETKELMQKFLEKSIGNTQLNSFLNQDTVKSQISYADYLTKSPAVNQIAYFSFKTRNINEMERVLDKLEKVHEAVLSGGQISDKDKLSLKEFAVASDLAKTLPMLEQFNKSGFIEGNEKLEKMYKNAVKAKEIVSYLEQESTKDLQKVGPGVLILDNTGKKSNVMGKVLSFVEKVVALFSGHGNASL